MIKIESAVWRETRYVAIVTLFFSVAMQLVFALLGKWDYKVILGNAFVGLGAVLNFFLMGLFVQKAVNLKDEKHAKKTVQLSLTLRYLLMFAILAVAALAPCFNTAASVISVFFPRIAITFAPLFRKDVGSLGGETK